MHSLIPLLVAAVAACAIARPHEGTPPPTSLLEPPPPSYRRLLPWPPREYLGDLIYRRFMVPHYVGYKESPRIPSLPEHDWLNKEIDRINRMQEAGNAPTTYEANMAHWIAHYPYLQRIYQRPHNMQRIHDYDPRLIPSNPESYQLPPPHTLMTPISDKIKKPKQELKRDYTNSNTKEEKNTFALTPLDKGYFDPDADVKTPPLPMLPHAMHEGGNLRTTLLLQPPRQIRQNPNLSRTKTLIAENLDPLRIGLGKDYRLPVSLLPSNLRWLKINHPALDVDYKESSHDDGYSTEKPRHLHVMESSNDLSHLTQLNTADSIYGVALIAAVGAALTMAIFGFAFGWYTLSKKAKAAADVDYPAYGVTGPTIDTSGDRKLAQSAHMYHYQHQKQQIIAMERNGLEQRNGSVSDPESEEENEEGDYTVYECPGFATTGDMEVKNPLFSEDPTPATPGKCEVVKPQPKD
ncbi:uncharacterized protein LOC113521113 isoform X2 [Galleria mellonella]|uniref:Uncharacterized protein LOC113521113 isoform X2 n=1 Tax=Galleria mellonella TaxID=7137 RepID=A0A6J3C5Y9_GALME|nr:uncharacterized protein LOC113521113 isoform X2 [Galleria mellonella]